MINLCSATNTTSHNPMNNSVEQLLDINNFSAVHILF